MRAPDDVDRLDSGFRRVFGCAVWLEVVCSHFLLELSAGWAFCAAPAPSASAVMPIASVVAIARGIV